MGCTSNQTGGIRYNTASIYSYAAFAFGLRHHWTYSLRTLPNIAPSLEPLERAIADLLVPAATDHVTTQEERDLLELPVCLGGLGLLNWTDSNLRFLMFGCAIQTQIRIKNCLRKRYSNYMKMRRRGNTAGRFWKWSKGHSHL